MSGGRVPPAYGVVAPPGFAPLVGSDLGVGLGRSTTNGFTSTCNVPGPGDAEHHHWMCCDPSCSGSAPRDPSPSDFVSLDSLRSRSACHASPFSHPSDRGASAVYIPSLYHRQPGARHLSTLPL